MSSIVKGYNAAIDEEEKKVINSNSMVADRIQLLKTIMAREASASAQGESSEDGFTEGLDAEMVDSLLMDPDAEPGAEGGNVIKAEQPVDPGIDLEAIQQEADQMIEEAKRQADLIIQEALDQAEANKASVFEEARSAGHDEGYAQGLSEAEQMKAEVEETRVALMQQYDQMVSELEPALVDTLSDIYGHIFSVDLSDRSEIILYLLQKALQNTDTTVDLMIHVSKEDYEYIQSNKETLFEGMPGIDNTEIVPDVTLHQGEAMIDTGSGIFDCSIGTELEGLKKQLMLLSYQQQEEA